MNRDEGKVEDIRLFWDNRAKLGRLAGTRDIIAKQLEIEAIAKYVCDGQRVLEVGCGNGITAIELARSHRIDILGIDFSKEMITAALDLAKEQELRGTLNFEVADVRNLPTSYGKFDLIYTERALINLPDWETQERAIKTIVDRLIVGGQYLMCENSQDGLDRINELRERLGLSPVRPPWHNRYFKDEEIDRCNFHGIELEGVDQYSSTYYFLSRIVNAWLASQEGKEPDYESPVNQLALRLPPIGNFGQGKIWRWRKISEDL